MNNFHVGQKVVCIDDHFENGHFFGCDILPKKGVVYTIREIECFNSAKGETTVLRLNEIINAVMPYAVGDVECGFIVRRFRPVVSRPTSIAVFKAMLTPSKQKELAR